MEGTMEEQDSGFKVTDRRMFTADGNPVPTEKPAPKEAAQAEPPPSRREVPEPEPEPEWESPPRGGMDFSTFIISLATSALAYLGEVPDPATGQRMQSLEGAQQMIEILSILQSKTKGNLTAEEADLLEQVLYELRMKYLAKSKVINL